jgi:hypothetical protein
LTKNIINSEYHILLDALKKHLRAVRYMAVASVNKELILFYHHVGTQILKSQANNAWGAKIIDQLSRDLQSDFPEIKGFSTRNLKYMRKFAQEYPDSEFVRKCLHKFLGVVTSFLWTRFQKSKLYYSM